MEKISTDLLEIACEISGPERGPPVLMLHGWPDDARAWARVVPSLNAAGFRTVTPWLRGHGETRFHSADTFRDGRAVALAADALALADALKLERFAVVGHDWGARTAYSLAALAPQRLTSIAALALGYSPRAAFPMPSFEQSRRWWYQWFMTCDEGAEAIARDYKGFDRLQWETWSPPGWFDDAEFEATARAFENPDWVPITLHGYRTRWQEEPCDPRYDRLQARLEATEKLAVPTLMIQGAKDYCDPPEHSEGLEAYFTAGYDRLVIDGVGHFPMREAPARVAAALVPHLRGFAA